jgi:hypothetical protein
MQHDCAKRRVVQQGKVRQPQARGYRLPRDFPNLVQRRRVALEAALDRQPIRIEPAAPADFPPAIDALRVRTHH